MNQKKKRKSSFLEVKLTKRQIKLMLLSSVSETMRARHEFEKDKIPGWVKVEEAGQRRILQALNRYGEEI